MTDKTFSDLGVAEPLCRALAADGYVHPTPIQQRSIPTLLVGTDLLGIAETGTGKTAAFALPILQRLAANAQRPMPKAPRVLILAPTRELAVQIHDSFKAYGRHLRLTYAAVFGGVGQGTQVQALARGIDVLVATPGRLLDLCGQRHINLASVSVLVLDEADRMLDMGFVRDVRRIVAMVPKERQTLLFSATMPEDIDKLAGDILRSPARVEIARTGKTVDRIDQRVHHVATTAKKDLLTQLLADPAMARVMVFTRTKRGANKVSEQLERVGINSDAIHGNKSQAARQKALDGFRAGRTRVLVATDIAARGLDIELVTHVINYELPHEPEAYVHRIGRTARAGAEGIAIAFCAPDERDQLRAIERLIRQPLTVVGKAATFDPRDPRLPEELGVPRKDSPRRPSDRPAKSGPSSSRNGHSRDAHRRQDSKPAHHQRRRGAQGEGAQSRNSEPGRQRGELGGSGRNGQNGHTSRDAGGPTPWAGWSGRAAGGRQTGDKSRSR